MNDLKMMLLRKSVQIINDVKADAAPEVTGASTVSDIPYIDDGIDWHMLDVYSPISFDGHLPSIVYVHGGGWSISDKRHFRHFCQTIAAGGYVVFSINYRLAPEHQHPAQLLDVLSAMTWVKSHAVEYGADPAKVFLFGDSSGAHLASLAACVCTNSELESFYNLKAPFGKKELYGCVLFCGPYDIETCSETVFPFIKDYVQALLGMDPGQYPDIDRLSTIKNITSNYPPCLISDSAQDALIEESRSIIKVLEQNGVKHKDLLLDDVGKAPAHEYQIEYDKPIFQICIDECFAFIIECLKRD
jgi:acetyl esterase/lipase